MLLSADEFRFCVKVKILKENILEISKIVAYYGLNCKD